MQGYSNLKKGRTDERKVLETATDLVWKAQKETHKDMANRFPIERFMGITTDSPVDFVVDRVSLHSVVCSGTLYIGI